MACLTLENLTIRYGGKPVIRDFSLEVQEGEMVSVLGPSGTGKTTLLKAVAGLLTPAKGDVRINGRSVIHLAPEKRDVVMVFQKPLLFPFLNVEKNVAFGLKMKGVSGKTAEKKVAELLDLTRLSKLGSRKIHQLSGGQQQRVALARALVLDPAVLLLDEPLSSLDANLRREMRDLIQTLQSRAKVTTLFVTHDQAEALTISHKVALMIDGGLRQFGAPRDLYHRPEDMVVARFFGGGNFFNGQYENGVFHSALGSFSIPQANGGRKKFTAFIRSEDVRVSLNGNGNGSSFVGRVVKANFEGIAARVFVQCGPVQLEALTKDRGYRQNQRVNVTLPEDKIRLFPADKSGPEEP